MIPRREIASSGLVAGLLYLSIGAAWVGSAYTIPAGTVQAWTTCALAALFAGTFVWILLRRIQRVFLHGSKTVVEMGLAIANMVLLLVAFGAVYSRFGIVDASTGEEVHGLGVGVYYSVVTFTTLGYGDFEPTGVLRFMAALQALTGYVILGIIASSTASLARTAAQARAQRDADRAENHEREAERREKAAETKEKMARREGTPDS